MANNSLNVPEISPSLMEPDQNVLAGVVVDGRVESADERLAKHQREGGGGVPLGKAAVGIQDVHIAVIGAAEECVVPRRADELREVLARVPRDARVNQEAD